MYTTVKVISTLQLDPKLSLIIFTSIGGAITPRCALTVDQVGHGAIPLMTSRCQYDAALYPTLRLKTINVTLLISKPFQTGILAYTYIYSQQLCLTGFQLQMSINRAYRKILM